MKFNLHLSPNVLMVLFFPLICTTFSKTKPLSGEPQFGNITQTEFNNWTAAWASNGKQYLQANEIVSYNMAVEDLQNLIQANAASARFYLGLQEGNQASNPKLIMVGINGMGSMMNTYYGNTGHCPGACGNGNRSKEVGNENATNAISMSTFQAWTGEWHEQGASFSQNSLTTHFAMQLINIQQVLGQSPTSVRLYLGLNNGTVHLILVGVDANGSEMNTFYNVTRPCPPSCEN